MIRTNRSLLSAAAFTAVALTATACGTVTQQATQKAAELAPAAMLKLVGEKTTAAKSAKVEMTMKMGAVETTSKGAIGWSNGLVGDVTMNAKGGPMAQMLGKAGGNGDMEIRYLPDAMYVNMGAMAAATGGKHWLEYKYDDLAKLAGAAGQSMKDQLKNADPTASVRSLLASGKVQKAGTDTVNGASATHYTGDLTVADISKQAAANGLTAAEADALKEQLGKTGMTSEHIEVWINSENLLVKQMVSGNTSAGEFSMTGTYSDYGTPVSAQPPAASDTEDFGAMLSGLKLGGTKS